MKILKLRFKNLNSLYDEWEIDFTAPEYIADGIFAITGPTGAGKSTVMDAVCLALYGATPRLGDISSGSNDIMSRNAGECFAEVVFESPRGRFRCHFNQHRAHKRADGRLSSPKHEIVDDLTGKILESKKSKVSKVVEEKTGMDFERFTRSMLLAQGSFAAFLQANASTRAPILEQITGTQIYCDISIAVHQRMRLEEEKLQKFRSSVEGMPVLSEEQEKELVEKLEIYKKKGDEIRKELESCEKAIAQLALIDSLEKEVAVLEDESKRLNHEFEQFVPEAQSLQLALKAAELEGEFSALEMLRKQQINDLNRLESLTKKLPELKKELTEKERGTKDSKKLVDKASKELKTQMPLFNQIRLLDNNISTKSSLMELREKESAEWQKELVANQKKLEILQDKLNNLVEEHENLLEFRRKNKNDEILISEFSAIKELMASLEKWQNDNLKLSRKVKKTENQVEKAKKKVEEQQKKYTRLETNLEKILAEKGYKEKQIEKLLSGRELKDYRDEHEACLRKIAEIESIKNFQKYRERLEDQKACPLCGALEHPFARGNIPVPDEAEKRAAQLKELFEKYEKYQSEFKKLEEEYSKGQKLLADVQRDFTESKHEQQSLQKDKEHLKKEFEHLNIAISQNREGLIKKLKSAGITDIPDKDFSDLVEQLQQRRDTWLKYSELFKESEKRIESSKIEIKGLEDHIKSQNKELKEKDSRAQLARKDYEDLMKQRKNIFADKDPDKEEQKLETAIENERKKYELLHESFVQIQKKCAESETRIADLAEETEKRIPTLEKLEKSFGKSLIKQGFNDEKSWFDAKMSFEKRQKLGNKLKLLEKSQAENRARHSEKIEKLAKERQNLLSQSPLDELNNQKIELKESAEAFLKETGALKQKLEDNQKVRSQLAEKYKQIESQQIELERWKELHGLIGSADGNKYRKFAQGLTFDLLIMHANRELEKLSERYILVQSEEIPLELSVIDNFQAGEIRSTKNLSGGESFIVSLALALGLSQMSSRNVRVDSLFLDEGFGTLDENALESALETLANLHGEGKLIGIISHVAALKDRIGTRIKIEPVQSRGKSRIEGPGCQKIQ
jgi:exonuclease SbcC